MDQERDKELDELFRKAMQNPDEINFREDDWSRMEEMLDRRRKPLIMWMRVAGGIAAMLLIALCMWWLLPDKHKNEQQNTARVKHNKPMPDEREKSEAPLVELNGDSVAGLSVRGGTAAGTQHRRESSYPAAAPFKQIAESVNTADTAEVSQNTDELASSNGNRSQFPGVDTAEQASVIAVNNPDTVVAEQVEKKNNVTKPARMDKKPVFAVSVLAAPDVNGIGSFGEGKMGLNAGVLLSMKLGSRLTVTTGAAYSYKPYATNFSNYRTAYRFDVNPTRVMADCRVLDIPLNIDYMVYSKRQNSMSFGAGLSSWFMLNEKYTFTYPGNFGGPQSYSVSNQNQHILGVLNLQATYHRQLNNKVGVAIQPFMKVPLTDIGYSQVRLRSLGIAAGLTWNLSP
ncbi:PorT family protein [Mucilaginibacter roseus]|uniref:PorT family protein n=1 Tax=Mucilaginibacter roseus TaxID=1528868 RepID=A0ABS8U079_9SPHI|nr:PorT family protein [Mucilaginibacter roseus]MCD8739475.1 PorT family protein [Mucilaginibacter roseus]